MTTNSSATAREHTPHTTRTTRTNTIMNALKERAQSRLNDQSIDAQSRAIFRQALERNDPWLAEMVRRADAVETVVATTDVSQTPETNEADSSKEKIEALAEIICSAGDECASALLVLMGMIQNASHPAAVANTAKHFAFTRCGELNVNGMVDAQIAALERELFAGDGARC